MSANGEEQPTAEPVVNKNKRFRKDKRKVKDILLPVCAPSELHPTIQHGTPMTLTSKLFATISHTDTKQPMFLVFVYPAPENLATFNHHFTVENRAIHGD